MEQSCQKCGAGVNAGQAFCPKCGAVVGMGDAGRAGGDAADEWDMASTFFNKKTGTAPLTSKPRSTAERAASAAHGAPAPAKPYAAARGGNRLLFAVLGFVAVLLAGGLLILLLYMNSKG